MSINGIEITDVIIFPVKCKVKGAHIQAFARIILNDQFVISGIRVMEGKNGVFVKYPYEISETNRKCDICFPVTAELRTYISDQVLSQYNITMNIDNNPEPPDIIVEINDGIVQKISGVPADSIVEIRDYDYETVDTDKLCKDESGTKYYGYELDVIEATVQKS
jgi:stage V sporulation protein G